MKTLVVLSILALAGCSSSTGPTTPPSKVDPTDPNLSFYGHVADIGTEKSVEGADVSLQCECGNWGPVYTNANGYYEMYGPSHEGHHAIIYCGAPGYMPMGVTLDVMGPAPEKHDFKLNHQ